MVLAIVLVLLVLGSVLFHFLSPWYFTPIASNWGMIDDTISITFWVTGFVFVVVNLFMAYAIFRYRHHKGGKAHYETLFDTAFIIWRKKGLVTRPVEAKDWADTRFLQALAADYPGQKVEEPKLAAKAPSEKDRAIINKQIQIHFTPGSDEIMAGSYLVLDALGETMTSFGNTYLRIEGNTDATGNPRSNMTLSERRALAVKNYVLQNFPGVNPSRFQTIGRGSTNPVADNTTEGGRQLNRRTEIKVILAVQ